MSYFDQLSAIVDLEKSHTQYGHGYSADWIDYAATVSRGGFTYMVGTVTVYPDGHVLLLKHHTLNAYARKAWHAMHEALGFPREALNHPAMFCTRPVGG